jgi:hypothetical protein
MIPALSGTSAAIVGLTGVTVAAGAALAATAVKAMDYTGKIDDLAQVTNLTTETIQSLQLAATLSGQSFEDVSQTAIIFQKRIEEAKNGNAELAATFKALGVDLNGPVDQAFRQTLERLNDLEDGSLKTSVSLDLFGKSGSKLLPVMDQVGGSFDGLIARARELGIVLSEEDIAKSNQFADQLDILSLKMKGLANDVGVGLINMLNDLGDAFVEAFDPEAAEKMRVKLEQMQNQAREQGTLDSTLRARLEGVDTGANAPSALQLTLEEARRKPTTGRTGGGAAARLVNLPSGEGVRRAYEQFRAALIAEEKATQAQREKLRIEAIQGEEAKLRDALIRQDEAISKARADAAAGARTGRAEVLNQIVANLEAEKTLTMRAIDEIETARVQAMMRFVEAANAQTADRLANELNQEQEYLDAWAQAYEDNLARIDEQIQASAARRRAAQEADPSSPLNLFGPAGQAAADRGAGIFGQLGASASEALATVGQQMGNFGTMMQDVLGGVASGLQNIIQGFIMTGRIGGQAFKALAASVISSVVAQAAVKAIFELAEGFAALARGDLRAATPHFAAAKLYGVVAGVAAAAAVGMAAIGPGGGEGSQFLAQDRGAGGTMIREQGGRRSSEPQVIIIRAETEPGVMVSKVVQDYRNNGEMRTALRRDLLGEF